MEGIRQAQRANALVHSKTAAEHAPHRHHLHHLHLHAPHLHLPNGHSWHHGHGVSHGGGRSTFERRSGSVSRSSDRWEP